MADSSNGFSGRCVHCGGRLEARSTRRKFCGDPCRWAAWKRERERRAVEEAMDQATERIDALIGLLDEALKAR